MRQDAKAAKEGTLSFIWSRYITRDELVKLAQDLLDVKVPEKDQEQVMHLLKQETGDPQISDYLYWSNPQMTAEDAVDKALGLRDVPYNPF